MMLDRGDNMTRGVRDNRRHARFEMFEYAVLYRENDPDGISALIVDISVGGLQVRARNRFLQGEVCTLVIGRGWEPPLTINVEIRYSCEIEEADLFATGVRYRPRDAQQRMELVDYLHDVFQRRSEGFIA